MSEVRVNGDVCVVDEEEGQKQVWRPPDIDQDMKEMERRKRVDMIMNSQLFREELERIIEGQMGDGSLPAALQQVTELLRPQSRPPHSCLIPINDLRGVDGVKYGTAERLLRCKLAAVYRLIDLYGWSENIYNHVTVRVSREAEHFLLNPFGLQYPEVTASSLIRVDLQGKVLDAGSTAFTFNRAGFVLHSAVHAARPDLRCCIHVHHPPVVAVSAMKVGLLPLSQEAALIGDVSYHDYNGILVDATERESIVKDLGPLNKVMILRNHGVLVCGESIEEALFYLHNIILACETQIKVMPIGLDNLQVMSDEARSKVRCIITENHASVTGRPGETSETPTQRKFRVWDLEFEAQMRMLDNAGFRTGYGYKYPLVRAEQPRLKNDVEVPPSATSFQLDEGVDRWLSPLRRLMEGGRRGEKIRWVNSPNVYQRVEVLETGTTDPKKITKWVSEGGASHGTPVKIDSPHQFLPPTVNGGDINEFKKKQKEMKANRFQSVITAGPQSSILEGGTTWENQQDDTTGATTVLVGAASKGIIQRDFQHHATVYKSAYAKNPFDNVSDQDLEEYKKIVERKQRGETIEEDIPEHIKPLLMEPVVEPQQRIVTPPPQSPTSDEEVRKAGTSVQRSLSVRLAQAALEDRSFQRRTKSERKAKSAVVNGEDASRSSSKESSPVKEAEKKKKKKGLRTPSFLKSKKKHKKEEKAT